MTKRTPPRPVQRTTGATIQQLLKASDRVSPAYVNGDDAGDDDRVSNLCDVGAHAWCDGGHCACACHHDWEIADEPA